MGRMQRNKGGRGEREVVLLAEAHGFTGLRTRSGGGQVRGDIAGIPGLALEVKRQEKLAIPEWMRQAQANCGPDIPAVAHRRNNEQWNVTLPLDDLLALVKRGQL
jgi:Holliday junction resolvase